MVAEWELTLHIKSRPAAVPAGTERSDHIEYEGHPIIA